MELIGPNAIARPRLLRQLARRFEFRCTIVDADAGHGKTTLLAQALSENALASRGTDIWLDIEKADNDGASLVADLLVALDAPRVDATVGAIADAVWRRAPTEVCIVLDE